MGLNTMQNLLLKRKLLIIFLMSFFLLLSLTGCSKDNVFSSLGFRQKSPESVESLAMKGLDYYEHGKYNKAKESFQTLLNLYPFSEYSLLAELKSADSAFHMEEYEEAVLQYMDFEERHPTNEAIPYVLFQIAMCYYKQIDTIDRDVSNAMNAIYSFSKLLRVFPNSPYKNETMARIRAARNFLANHEYYVASFYERTGAYEEAEARLEYLLNQYPQSTISPKAETLLSALNNGNPPGRSMFGWLPKRLPDWEDLTPEE
ncbi:outer membrane protein assembly factor BamD [Thermodesulfobacteriota bacterium]